MDWKEKLNIYREFYDDIRPEILEHDQYRFVMKSEIYKLTQSVGLSPIEEIIWDQCFNDNIVLYPQFPIFNLMVDFCNPVKKLIIECDGKPFHDELRDKERDKALLREGYKVFRLSGSKIVADYQFILDKINDVFCEGVCESDQELLYGYYEDYYSDTGHGFIRSLKDILLNSHYNTRPIPHFDHKINSLMRNRIIDFKVLPEYQCI